MIDNNWRTASGSSTIKLSAKVISALGIADRAAAALKRGSDFFPSRLALRAYAQSNRLRAGLERRLKAGFTPARAEFVRVPKWGGSTRPGADMASADRLLLDGLANAIRAAAPEGVINWSLRGDDRLAAEDLLTEGDHTHVVVTDLVSFYEYVDRPLLIAEIADLVEDDELVLGLDSLLTGVMGRTKGLPQGAPDVEILADIYLSMADRTLARAGTEIIRWADDYRIRASSLADACRRIVDLEEAIAPLGLVIGAGKTYTPTVDVYREWTKENAATRHELNELITRIRLRIEADYRAVDDDDDNPQPRQRRRPDRALERELRDFTGVENAWPTQRELVQASKRLRWILAELARTHSNTPLGRLAVLLRRYPHLTRDIATYLRRRIVAENHAAVEATVAAIQTHQYLYDWQEGWLWHALVPATTNLPAETIARARQAFSSDGIPSFVRGRAAVVLATENELPLGPELRDVYDELPYATQVDIVAAVAWLPQSPERDAFIRSAGRDPLFREVSDIADQRFAIWL